MRFIIKSFSALLAVLPSLVFAGDLTEIRRFDLSLTAECYTTYTTEGGLVGAYPQTLSSRGRSSSIFPSLGEAYGVLALDLVAYSGPFDEKNRATQQSSQVYHLVLTRLPNLKNGSFGYMMPGVQTKYPIRGATISGLELRVEADGTVYSRLYDSETNEYSKGLPKKIQIQFTKYDPNVKEDRDITIACNLSDIKSEPFDDKPIHVQFQ